MDLRDEQVVRAELDSDESLLWCGQPRRGVALRSSDVLAIPFSLLWGGFALFWEGSVLTTNAPVFFRLWGVPFVIVGLYIIAGRFWADSYLRSRTWYGLSNRRVVIVSGFLSNRVKSYSLAGLHEIALEEKADRSGTITLGAGNTRLRLWAGTPWPGMADKMVPALEMIRDARMVHDLIRRAQRDAR